jgi:predicted HAD superfamily Cof-like phosphohydrolase
MTKETKRVRDFMRFFGQDCPEYPTQIDQSVAVLRASLVLEETLEMITKGLGLEIIVSNQDAPLFNRRVLIDEQSVTNGSVKFGFIKLKEVNLKETLDGVCDLFFVSEGTAIACGIDTEPAHEEVARSNASKKWTKAQLEQGIKDNPGAKIEDYGGGLYRLKREDGKIIKSPTYSPADLESVINEQRANFKAAQQLTLL